MSRYFTIMTGLRGCYMPDSACPIRVDTRRELKAAIESEVEAVRDAGFIGLTKRDSAWAANLLWRKGGQSAAILSYGRKGESARPFSIETARISRADYLESLESES